MSLRVCTWKQRSASSSVIPLFDSSHRLTILVSFLFKQGLLVKNAREIAVSWSTVHVPTLFMCIVDSGSWTQILELAVLYPLLRSSQFKLSSSRNKTIILLESEKNLWKIPKHLHDKGLRDNMDTRYIPKNNKGNI